MSGRRAPTGSVAVGATHPLHLRSTPLLSDPPLHGRLRRPRMTARSWRGRGRFGQNLNESALGGLAIPQLRPMLRRDDRENAVHEAPGETLQRPRSQGRPEC